MSTSAKKIQEMSEAKQATTARPLNIYGRLSKARTEFHALEIKKSGLNKFSGGRYFTQEDILTNGLPFLHRNDLLPIVTFDTEMATLTLYSTTTDEKIVFTSPMSSASLKGCHEVQNLGAVESYETRYLYIQLLQVVETDELENTKAHEKSPLATPEQMAIMHDYAQTDLMTSGQKSWLEKAGDKITQEQAEYVIEKLKEKESA